MRSPACCWPTSRVAIVEHRTRAAGHRRASAARRWLLGVIAAELPDADLVYSGPVLGIGKLGYLLHHRGHTHTIVVALALAGAGCLGGTPSGCGRRTRRPAGVAWRCCALALAGTLSHLLLDFTNSYGVHPFWPVDNAWHYGDAIFIVEPWLWVLVIPALLYGARRRHGARAALALALVAILLAAWGVDLVSREAAIALTVAAAAGLVLMPRLRHPTRLALAARRRGCWWRAHGIRGLATRGGARSPRWSAPSALRDVVLTPAAANPLCVNAIVVEDDARTYRVSTATVAAWPACAERADVHGRGATRRPGIAVPMGGLGGGLQPSTRADVAPRCVGACSGTAPRAALRALATTRCDVAAALEFMRVPVWERAPRRIGACCRISVSASAAMALPTCEFGAPSRTVPGCGAGLAPPRADLLSGVRGLATGG